MNGRETGDRLRAAAFQLHQAAIQPDPLNQWSHLISKLLDADLANLTVFGPSGTAIVTGSVLEDRRKRIEFIEYYQYQNPIQKLWKDLPSGRVLEVGHSQIGDDVRKTEFYMKYRDELGTGDGALMPVSVRTSKVLVYASQSSRRSGGINKKLLADLHDDLQLSFEIAAILSHASKLASNIIRSFDEKGIGVAVLSEDGTVENANSSMKETLNAGNVLRLEQDRLAPGSVRMPDFPSLIQRTRKSGVGGKLAYGDPSGMHQGSIIAYPSPIAHDWEGIRESKVVLIMTDNSRPKGMLSERLRRTYGLTNGETRVAGLLLDGKTSRNIADSLSVQINSVRAHLKSIYFKTGVHSQVELLNLLQRERLER